ncbi:MAG TPA: HAMP domain-containing sensor histidine kinase, partial [bacterium]|nr:HAMP domain-containing sensor histidine kinase [bacterium]
IDVVVVTTVPLFALLLLLNAYQFWKQVFDPLAQLDAVTQRLARGEMDARVTVTRQDELGALADTFNTMADALAAREMERQHALAAVAHDLRGPLTIISGLNELLPMSTPAQHKEYHARIAAQCRRLEEMTRDLMETVRIESGKLTVARDQVDVAQVVRETVADLCELHRDREITLAGPNRCPVVGDALRLARVISNLLTNALKYSQPEMPVAVTLTRTATHVRVAIADQGQGMTDDEIKQLFQPFSRLSRTAHSRAGTGLGLYSVHRIVEAHGGRVWLESVPGSGTTAMVELPLA